MKKTIFVLMLFLLFLTNVSALSRFSQSMVVPNMNMTLIRGKRIHMTVPIVLTREDKEIVYSLDPFVYQNVIDYYEEYKYNDKIFNITEEQLDKINLIAYYGYNYKNHTDLNWYAFTQLLIWKSIDLSDGYFTDGTIKNKIDEYDDELQEIITLVDEHYKLPSIANQHYEHTIDSNYKLEDVNKVLHNYEIKETNLDAKIVNDELIMNIKENGNYRIQFIRKNPVDKDYILYYLSGSSPLFYPGKIKDITFEITVEVNEGSITINKKDIDNKNIAGVTYGIYNNIELITTLTTNDEGVCKINNLPLGKYYIKEIDSIIPYKLDEKTYEVDITKENKNIVITSYGEVIKGNLIINNYYDKENTKLENKIIFEIYDVHNNLIGEYSTENGTINVELPYGKYYLKQVKGIKGYKFIDKFDFSIKEEKEYIYDIYSEKELIVVEVPDTLKYNYNKYISIALILIGSILIVVGKIRKKALKNY